MGNFFISLLISALLGTGALASAHMRSDAQASTSIQTASTSVAHEAEVHANAHAAFGLAHVLMSLLHSDGAISADTDATSTQSDDTNTAALNTHAQMHGIGNTKVQHQTDGNVHLGF